MSIEALSVSLHAVRIFGKGDRRQKIGVRSQELKEKGRKIASSPHRPISPTNFRDTLRGSIEGLETKPLRR